MQIFSKKICKYQFFFVPLRRILVNYIIMEKENVTKNAYSGYARVVRYIGEVPHSQPQVLTQAAFNQQYGSLL